MSPEGEVYQDRGYAMMKPWARTGRRGPLSPTHGTPGQKVLETDKTTAGSPGRLNAVQPQAGGCDP